MSAHHTIRDNNGLSLDTVRQHVPSVFATKPWDKTSPRYGFVPTVDIVEGLHSAGFNLVSAGQSLTRMPDRREAVRHVLRFRPQLAPTLAGGSLPEVALVNSHDGSSGFKLFAGLFRLVCANGLIVSTSTLQAVTIHHRANAVETAQQKSLAFLSNIDYIGESIGRFINTPMQEIDAYKFAAQAAKIRWGSEMPAGLNSRDLLTVRRYDDAYQNLWAVMNVIQENLTKGGVNLNRPNSRRASSTRGMRSVTDDVRTNAQLWQLAEKFHQGETIDVDAVEV